MPAALCVHELLFPHAVTQFQHVSTLALTVKEQELYTLENEELLYRLYHQETVHLFPSKTIAFKCNCSKERCLTSLASIAPEEIQEILKEQGTIDMHCEYCGSDYHLDDNDVQILLTGQDNTEH